MPSHAAARAGSQRSFVLARTFAITVVHSIIRRISLKALKLFVCTFAFLSLAPAAQASGCRDANGQWAWFNKAVVHLTPDGHASTNRGGYGSYACKRGVVVIRWAGAKHYVDTLTLSPNGGAMSGFNQFNVPVSARKM
jgi:hypothetical protein